MQIPFQIESTAVASYTAAHKPVIFYYIKQLSDNRKEFSDFSMKIPIMSFRYFHRIMNKASTVIVAILVALATTTGLLTALSMMSRQTSSSAY